ncbi:MAG: hypothetical protein HQM08_25425 [Candidatus Riflebacteria bacterium]|nr:hypothetical protein [Candidatus Riflebacteria bacterium]
MKKIFLLFVAFFAFCSFFQEAFAVEKKLIQFNNPELLGLISIGEEGAAWITASGTEWLVTPGFRLDTNLRVTAVKPEGVIIYSDPPGSYISLDADPSKEYGDKHHTSFIWCQPIEGWKVVRMLAMVYRKDFIAGTQFEELFSPKGHFFNMEELNKICFSNKARIQEKNNIFFALPQSEKKESFSKKEFGSILRDPILEKYPKVRNKFSLIANGKELNKILKEISRRTGIPINFESTKSIKIYCSLKDRSFIEIIDFLTTFFNFDTQFLNSGLRIFQ